MKAIVSLASFPASKGPTGEPDSSACLAPRREPVEEFLAETWDRCGALWQQLDERHQALLSQRQRMHQDFRDRAAALDQERAGLAAQWQEIREAIRRAVAAAAAADMAEALNRERQETAS